MDNITSESLKTVDGSFLELLQARDSILIADQLRYGVRLEKVKEHTALSFPDYGNEGFCEGFELVSPWKLDTLRVHKAKKGQEQSYDIEASVVVTTFDEGDYVLPPLVVSRQFPDGVVDTLVFNPQEISVKTMPVDTADFQVHDIKAQVRYPVTFREVLPYLGIGLLVAAIIALVIFLVKKYSHKAAEAAVAEPAHIVALRKLDNYRGDRLWAPEKQKLFYSGVTDTLREYIDARYGVGAMEMTTKEIMDAMKDKEVDPELMKELRELFERADFVKFAKFTVDNQDNASVVPFAVRFVTQTYQAELDKESDYVS